MSELVNKEEEIQHRPFNPQLLGKLLTYLQPHKRRVALAFLTIAFSAFSSQVGPFLTQKAVDNHIVQGDYAGSRSSRLSLPVFSFNMYRNMRKRWSQKLWDNTSC